MTKNKTAVYVFSAAIFILGASIGSSAPSAHADGMLLASNTPSADPNVRYQTLVKNLRKKPVTLDDLTAPGKVQNINQRANPRKPSGTQSAKNGGEFSGWADGFFTKDVSPY